MSEVISYKLTGDWRHIVEDGLVDLDDLPDEALPTGHVEFIPLAPQVAVSGSPETAYTLASFKSLIAGGVLTDLQGREGVQIAGKIGDTPVYWQAVTHLEYRGKKIDYPTIEFTLEADARLTGIIASEIPGESATIYHPRIEALIYELDSKSDVGHGHRITDVEGLQQALEDAANSGGDGTGGGGGGPVSWTLVTNKPTTFPPSSHTHPLGDVSGLQGALDAKVGNTDPRLSDARQPTAHTHSWASLTGKPSTFPPDGHGHSISDVSGLQQALEDAANSGTGGGGGDGSPVTWISVLNKPSEFPPEAHTHLIRDVNGLQGALDEKIGDTDPRLTDARTPKSHTHYWSEVTGKPLSYPPATHTHQIGDTTGLQGALDSKVGNSDPRLSDARTPTEHTHVWDEVTEKPSVFPPEVHGHAISQVTGLQGALDGKAATGHGHSINDVDGLQAALDAAAGSGGDGGPDGPRVYVQGHPYLDTLEIPNPKVGDVFWMTDVGHVYFYNSSGLWFGSKVTPGTNSVTTGTINDGAVTRVKLDSDVRTELDDLRTDLDSVDDGPVSWSSLTGKPTEFPPSTHGHQISEVNGLQAALDSKIEGTGEITAESLGAVERAGDTTTLWSGTQAEYDALPEATRHAVGFVAVIR